MQEDIGGKLTTKKNPLGKVLWLASLTPPPSLVTLLVEDVQKQTKQKTKQNQNMTKPNQALDLLQKMGMEGERAGEEGYGRWARGSRVHTRQVWGKAGLMSRCLGGVPRGTELECHKVKEMPRFLTFL